MRLSLARPATSEINPSVRALRRIALASLLFCSALFIAYLADTVGKVTFRIRGVVLEAKDGAWHLDTYGGRSASQVHQVLISIPGRTFWWIESFPVGAPVVVHVLEGRFSGWRYVRQVESP